MVEIFGEHTGAHQFAVEVDVLREARVAGLDELLGDDFLAVLHHARCEVAGHIAFAGVGVYA